MESRVERARGFRKEAAKYAKLASSGGRDITTSFVQRKLADQYIWMAEDLERRENLAHTMVGLLGRHE
jgi:ABC-type sulfate transport system substrate-binding protein